MQLMSSPNCARPHRTRTWRPGTVEADRRLAISVRWSSVRSGVASNGCDLVTHVKLRT